MSAYHGDRDDEIPKVESYCERGLLSEAKIIELQVIAYHLRDGFSDRRSTFIPKRVATNVRGRKMKVTQLSLQRLMFN